jgi:hypothetical protein
VLQFTVLGGTETTSGPWLTDTVLITILTLVLAAEDSLDNTACVLPGPLFPKLDGPPRHGGGKKGFDSGPGEGGDGEGEHGD